MERASVATDGDSRTAMDGAKWPLEWVPQGIAEQLRFSINTGQTTCLRFCFVGAAKTFEPALEILLFGFHLKCIDQAARN